MTDVGPGGGGGPALCKSARRGGASGSLQKREVR